MKYARYIKGHEIFVIGDERIMPAAEFDGLKALGIVTEAEMPRPLEDVWTPTPVKPAGAPVRRALTGKNIYGRAYRAGGIDVVVPCRMGDAPACAVEGDGVTLAVLERNFTPQFGGFAKACNDGAKMREGLGEFILFVNSDVVLGDGWADAVRRAFADEAVAVVGAECSRVDWGVNGSFMAVRRELFELWNGFDERYFFMWEDNDLCQQARARGWAVVVCDADVRHEGGASTKTETEFWRRNYWRGKTQYHEKWAPGRIIGCMIVGNEDGRYLERAVADLFKRRLIDELCVTCDASNEATMAALYRMAEYWPITIVRHAHRLFGKAEGRLREAATSYAASLNPYGIICTDADEILDSELNRAAIYNLLAKGDAFDFPIAHFWGDENHVRVDGAFCQQANIRLYRWRPDWGGAFFSRKLHCGSAPSWAYTSARKPTEFILKHYGYVRPADVADKVARQKAHDPNMQLENPDFYRRIEDGGGEIIEWNKREFLRRFNGK